MQIRQLKLTDFRNHSHTLLEADETLNYLYGDNASGKTSLLEAIYLLGFGKSFVTSRLDDLIATDHASFVVNAVSRDEISNRQFQIGFVKKRANNSQLRINQDRSAKLSGLVQLFPIQAIHPTSSLLLLSSATLRRQAVDWGVFHVKQDFSSLWQRYTKVVSHRNRLLRNSATTSEYQVWDHQLVELAIQIQQNRHIYVEQLSAVFQPVVDQLLPGSPIGVTLYPGWDSSLELMVQLQQRFAIDKKRGFTSIGAHRADLKFTLDGINVKGRVSRGQLKLITLAFILAQLRLIGRGGWTKPILLLDDLNSELDSQKRHLVIQLIAEQKMQTFITNTSIDDQILEFFPSHKLFHVKQGGVE